MLRVIEIIFKLSEVKIIVLDVYCTLKSSTDFNSFKFHMLITPFLKIPRALGTRCTANLQHRIFGILV